jgi:hypothetical protein
MQIENKEKKMRKKRGWSGPRTGRTRGWRVFAAFKMSERLLNWNWGLLVLLGDVLKKTAFNLWLKFLLFTLRR